MCKNTSETPTACCLYRELEEINSTGDIEAATNNVRARGNTGRVIKERMGDGDRKCPTWHAADLREPVIFEFQRAYFHHGFNRHAWVLLRPLDPATFEYHGDQTRRVGHALSLVARLVLAATTAAKQAVWTRVSTYLVNIVLLWVEGKSAWDIEVMTFKPVSDIREVTDGLVADLVERAREQARVDPPSSPTGYHGPL